MTTTNDQMVRKILTTELRTHKMYLHSGFVTSIIFSGLYWAYLTTAGFSREWTITTIAAFIASMVFILTYEGTKKQATKYLGKGAIAFLIPFVLFSVVTALGTMLLMEQKTVEEKTTASNSYQDAKKSKELAEADLRQFAWAQAINTEKEEAKKTRLMNQTAVRPNGKSSGKTVSYVLAKNWPSYAHYSKQVDAIDDRITAAQKYASAKAMFDKYSEILRNSKSAGSDDNAQWLISGVGNTLFSDSDKKIMYAAFIVYIFATLILELAGYFNGQKIRELTRSLYGVDPGNLSGLRLAPTVETYDDPDDEPTPPNDGKKQQKAQKEETPTDSVGNHMNPAPYSTSALPSAKIAEDLPIKKEKQPTALIRYYPKYTTNQFVDEWGNEDLTLRREMYADEKKINLEVLINNTVIGTGHGYPITTMFRLKDHITTDKWMNYFAEKAGVNWDEDNTLTIVNISDTDDKETHLIEGYNSRKKKKQAQHTQLNASLMKAVNYPEFNVIALRTLTGSLQPVQNQIAVKEALAGVHKVRDILMLLSASGIEVLRRTEGGRYLLCENHAPTGKDLPFNAEDAQTYVEKIISFVEENNKEVA